MIPPMSRDRFNSNVDRKVKTEVTQIWRVEVITGVERRRDWTDEQKLSIIAESCQDGAVISDVARRHGLRPQQLFNWRNEFRKRKTVDAKALAAVLARREGRRMIVPPTNVRVLIATKPVDFRRGVMAGGD